MIEKMIVDADLCVKLGSSKKYRFLYDVLPMIAENIYIHSHVHGEVLIPSSAVEQLGELVSENKVKIVDEKELEERARVIFDAAYVNLSKVMVDPARPNKNKGEVCSLAYAKATGIPIFATDEKNLQPIIDSQLNTGIDDISCLRIEDIIHMAHVGKIRIPRKTCKMLWAIAGKKKESFDIDVWPLKTSK